MQYSRITIVVLTGVIVFGCLLLTGCSYSDATQQLPRSDIVTIDDMSVFGPLERPSVQFPHDLHTEALEKQGRDCSTCHLKESSGLLSQKFMRLNDADVKTVMDAYHENCIACHEEIATTGAEAGPVTCGECHQRQPAWVSSRQSAGFDKFLHYRHIQANDNDCAICHTDETKGQEQSCRNCHASQGEPSLKHVMHTMCIGCHSKNEKSGPQNCAGCHEAENLAAIETIHEVPRLKRGQPDFVLLGVPESELDAGKLKTVPFSHDSHEKFTATCRVCHHESIERCNECHTLSGTDEGAGITLEQAMHNMKSNHSCIGCHEVQKTALECAGCHSLMEQGRPSERTCKICHTGPPADKLTGTRGEYRSLAQFKPKASDVRLSFSEKDIPEVVTIGVLSDLYEPASFPHRKIVNTLMQYIGSNRVASHFHGHEDVVCQGCHHHSTIGTKPALCRSCHGKRSAEQDPFKPALYGAYHRQCIGCHQNMNIGEPSDCASCHAERRTGSSQ